MLTTFFEFQLRFLFVMNAVFKFLKKKDFPSMIIIKLHRVNSCKTIKKFKKNICRDQKSSHTINFKRTFTDTNPEIKRNYNLIF